MASAAAPPPLPPSSSKKVVTIDGSHGEGGGQILRNAAALAVITGTPLRVHSIRAGRAPKPGLRPQHLHGLELVAAISGFELQGGVVGSSEITLMPPREKKEKGTETNKTIRVDTKTAASTLLMIQTALPCLLLMPSSLDSSSSSSPSSATAEAGTEAAAAAAASAAAAPSSTTTTTTTTLELVGGTDASAAPPADYARLVLLPTLTRAFAARPPPPSGAAAPPSSSSFEVDLRVRRRGFFPRGQGVVSLTVKSLRRGTTLPPIVLERRRTKRSAGGQQREGGSRERERERVSVEVEAFSAGAGVPDEAARSAAEACVKALLESGAVASREQISVAISRLRSPGEALGDGGGVIAVAKVEGDAGEGGEEAGSDPLLLGSALPLSPAPKGSNKKRKTTAAATGAPSSSHSPAPPSPAEVGAQVGSDLARDLSSGGGRGGERGGGGTAATDRWLQDQLIVFMALAEGHSRVETCALTEHTRSAIAVAEALTPARFKVVESGNGACLIECEGAGVEAR